MRNRAREAAMEALRRKGPPETKVDKERQAAAERARAAELAEKRARVGAELQSTIDIALEKLVDADYPGLKMVRFRDSGQRAFGRKHPVREEPVWLVHDGTPSVHEHNHDGDVRRYSKNYLAPDGTIILDHITSGRGGHYTNYEILTPDELATQNYPAAELTLSGIKALLNRTFPGK